MADESTKSPGYDDRCFEQILHWAEATVFYHSFGEGDDEESCWVMDWGGRYIQFQTLMSPDDENKARRASAMYIYLATRDASHRIAERCAEAYVHCCVVFRDGGVLYYLPDS